ncbi:MAG: conjugal transfer protein TraF [Planctomycetota bacterium]
MRKISIISCVALMGIMIGSALQVSAEEWTIYGPRAESMGGAGVAMGDGATAHYWNPGATTKNDQFGLYIPFGGTVSAEGDIMKSVDKLYNAGKGINWPVVLSATNGGAILTTTQAEQVLNFFSIATSELSKPGQGMLVSSVGGISFAVGQLTVFGNGFINSAIDPVGDDGHLTMASSIANFVGTASSACTNTALAATIAGKPWWSSGTLTQAQQFVYLAEHGGANTSDPAVQQSIILAAQATAAGLVGGSSISNNKSGVVISGIIFNEVGASYSQQLFLDGLSVGANLKMMEGTTYYNYIGYKALKSSKETQKDIDKKEYTKQSMSLGIDVGALYVVNDQFRTGLTIRNVNTPKFAYAGPGDVKLYPQIRAGVAVDVLPGLLVAAADYDLTKNKSDLLDGYESQMFGLGAEVNLIGVLRLRAGTSQNLASKVSSSVYTYGVGINLLLLNIDVGGSFAKKMVETKMAGGGQMPERTTLTVAVSLRF